MNPFDGILERCPYCKRFMTPEQVEKHVCHSPLIDVKEIDVLHYFEKNDKKNGNLILARGLDGVLYKIRQQKLPIRRKNTELKSDADDTEPKNKMVISYVYCSALLRIIS